MNIKYSKEILKSLENAITVVALFEGEDVSTTFDKINMISRNFNSKENSIDTVTLVENNNLVNVCLVGFGKRELLNREKIRIIGGNLCKKLKNILLKVMRNRRDKRGKTYGEKVKICLKKLKERIS